MNLNANDRAVVAQLRSDYDKADEPTRIRLNQINDGALSNAHRRRNELLRELRAVDRAIAAHLGSAQWADPDHPLVFQQAVGAQQQGAAEEHVLSRSELLTVLPPVPALEAEQRQLIEAANGGALAMTDLEWKLRVAGAGEQTIARAQSRRSGASAQLAARSSLSGDVDQELTRLTDRLLEHADAVTADVVGSAATTAQASRPAEIIYGRLVQQTAQLAHLDEDGVLAGDGDLVIGLLCELSDQCRYAWRSS